MSSAPVKRYQAQVFIRELLTFSYDSDSDFTAALQKSKGNITLELNHQGEVTVSGNAEQLVFSLTQKQRARIGFDMKWVKIDFSAAEGGLFSYRISGRYGFVNFSFSGLVDLFQLIKNCSGLLCSAARVINVDSRADLDALRAFSDK